MVAAHLADLKAAKDLGLQAIYVEREKEEDWGKEDVDKARGWVDLWVEKGDLGSSGKGGFLTVAERLGIELKGTPQRRRSSTN
jgi:2-haloacid dehalogenase